MPKSGYFFVVSISRHIFASLAKPPIIDWRNPLSVLGEKSRATFLVLQEAWSKVTGPDKVTGSVARTAQKEEEEE